MKVAAFLFYNLFKGKNGNTDDTDWMDLKTDSILLRKILDFVYSIKQYCEAGLKSVSIHSICVIRVPNS